MFGLFQVLRRQESMRSITGHSLSVSFILFCTAPVWKTLALISHHVLFISLFFLCFNSFIPPLSYLASFSESSCTRIHGVYHRSFDMKDYIHHL